MRDRLILLPGWGLGVSPLEPLAAALQGLDEHLLGWEGSKSEPEVGI